MSLKPMASLKPRRVKKDRKTVGSVSAQSAWHDAERKRRVAAIQPLLDKEMSMPAIAEATGYSLSAVSHTVRRYCKRPASYKPNPNLSKGTRLTADHDEADPSFLTPEQRERAKRLGMTEGRFAWLCKCPVLYRPPETKKKLEEETDFFAALKRANRNG